MILIERDAPEGRGGGRAAGRGERGVPSAAGAEGNDRAGLVVGRRAGQIVGGQDVVAVEPVRQDPFAVAEIAAINRRRRGDVGAGDSSGKPGTGSCRRSRSSTRRGRC